MSYALHHGDNLALLRQLRDEGAKFDLVELDGPYMAGIGEGWDNLTEQEYIDHYAARLALVRDILQPWGVVFVFGYPEGCAEIKSWARRSKTLHLRRWLHWYKQVTAHKARKVDVVCVFTQLPKSNLHNEFKSWLSSKRNRMGYTVTEAMAITPCRSHLSGKGCGMMWFESPASSVPTSHEYIELKRIFGIPDRYDMLCSLGRYPGITDCDFISATYSEETAQLNGDGLRSKPIGLYLDLFKPTIPPTDERRALILYGGSGNAGIAAAALGYDVTICEQDAVRCEAIRERWDGQVARWRQRLEHEQQPLPLPTVTQGALL